MHHMDGLTTTADGCTHDLDSIENEANSAEKDGAQQRAAILTAILCDCRDPADLIELFYWSREPDMLKLFRTLARLPHMTRQTLEFALSHAGPDSTLSIAQGGTGETIEVRLQLEGAPQAAAGG